MEQFRAISEPEIRQKMLDPDAAKIRFPVGLIRGQKGYVTCVGVNGKNMFGGYTGERFIQVSVANGAVTLILMPKPSEGGEFVDGECRRSIANHEYPPAN